jgi:hypothetical protein
VPGSIQQLLHTLKVYINQVSFDDNWSAFFANTSFCQEVKRIAMTILKFQCDMPSSSASTGRAAFCRNYISKPILGHQIQENNQHDCVHLTYQQILRLFFELCSGNCVQNINFGNTTSTDNEVFLTLKSSSSMIFVLHQIL